MHWTKAAIEELDRQRAKWHLTGDMPLLALTEQAVKLEDGREVHAADVREAGEKYGASIRQWREGD